MPKARKHRVSLEQTPYYHIVSRCVRRAYLCGSNNDTGKNYEHRRLWIEGRLRLLSSIFAVDICSYAIMSNHYHVVLKLCPEESHSWSTKDIITRWHCLHKGTLLTQQFLEGKPLDNAQSQAVEETASIWKKRLCDLSWFMKCINEPIARLANKEDRCTGHFWESRFHSDPLMTEEALLTAMVYVDLNPIRAKMAKTPEESEHTSIKERITQEFDLGAAIKSHHESINSKLLQCLSFKELAKFDGAINIKEQCGIPFSTQDYILLVEATGRIQREDKRGFIPKDLPPIIQRLGFELDEWLDNSARFEEKLRYKQRWRKKSA